MWLFPPQIQSSKSIPPIPMSPGFRTRNILYQVQTPQGFHNQTLQEAYALALKDPDFKTTDDCSVVKKYLPQEEIKIVKGEAYNMKFTYKEDIIILEQLLKNEGKCYV